MPQIKPSFLKSYLVACIRRAVEVEIKEVAALVLSFCYFFSILCAYFIIRPLRDEMAIAGGVHALPWLFTGTFIAMVCVVPLFGAIVSRFPRAVFIPYVYWFFIANLLVFWLLFQAGAGKEHVARAFVIWTSVFNLFVVSVFWSFMVDLFSNEQGRRLFGFIAAGGTAGTIAGPLVTLAAIAVLDPVNLLLLASVILAFAIFCVRALLRAHQAFAVRPAAGSSPAERGQSTGAKIGGGIFAGITEILKSRYLLGIGIFVAMFTWTSTFIYFQQANIIAENFDSPLERTRIFAFIDLSVSSLTILTQIFITGRFVKLFGVAAAVAFLPAVTLAGFGLFAVMPTVTMLIIFQIVRRASNFAITRPGREMLFTVVTREQKYKSKNFIDTAVYRGGDAVSGWAFTGLSRGLGFDLAGIAAVCMPIVAAWMGLAWLLGRKQAEMAKDAQEVETRPAY